MASEKNPPVAFDDDNPEWLDQDFAAARPAAEVLSPDVLAAFGKGKRGRPTGSTKADAKKQVTLRLDPDVLAGWRETGPGWQVRINDALRKALSN
ncbi:hypothetical protein AWL63_07005 [Sphingomonas panacis]|uniref:Antitoxin n=1 Tax=Sphingomonas panacis TaxID=1560345 RepID=A0A1B3Z8L3_9SPHN|nr:BrnA antitoxin family protein [Sphingomonas panacis]AOH83754.1 hypothetical protein AWL63_07005 [Sphingomonas panacis]